MPSSFVRATLLALCLTLATPPSALAAPDEPSALSQNTVKDQLTHRGPGHAVRLIRTDGAELKGRILTVGDDAVDLQPKGTSAPKHVPYAEIAQVKGPGLGTGAKVGIGVGIGVVALAGILAIYVNHELTKPLGP